MTRKCSIAVLLCLMSVACHRQKDLKRSQQNYDVVQEGSATNGASSTINAPGETPPPVTSTSADTTTDFALPGAQTQTTTAPPGSLGSTLPQTNSGSVYMPAPPRVIVPQQRRPYSTPSVSEPPPRTTTTTDTTTTARPPESENEQTTTQPPPPSSETTSTTSTEEKKQPTDTQPPPQNPPTATDTRGH